MALSENVGNPIPLNKAMVLKMIMELGVVKKKDKCLKNVVVMFYHGLSMGFSSFFHDRPATRATW